MINFLEKNPLLNHSQSIVITYPRKIQIVFGHYPYPEEIHNLMIEIKQNIDEKISYASNVKGGMTDWNYFKENPKVIKFLNYCINKHTTTAPELFQYFYENKFIEDAWGNEIKKGDSVHNHIHPCYHGILYLTEGEPLILPELNIEIVPKPGDYYFFPPFIHHYVNPHQGEINRYNIILNINEKKNWDKNKKIYNLTKGIKNG